MSEISPFIVILAGMTSVIGPMYLLELAGVIGLTAVAIKTKRILISVGSFVFTLVFFILGDFVTGVHMVGPLLGSLIADSDYPLMILYYVSVGIVPLTISAIGFWKIERKMA